MQNHHDQFIGGQWIESSSAASIEVENPAREEVWATVPDGDRADIDAAVTAARGALGGWSARTASERATYLRRFADAVDRHGTELARLTTTENGTPIAESSAAPGHGATMLRLTADLAPHLDRPDRRPNPMTPGHSDVLRRPVGVAGLITPWNFPLSLILIKLAPALLAGCTVVVKPAPETPMAARLLMRAAMEAEIPDGVVNMVTGGTEAGVALVDHPDIDKISFTGSTDVGRRIGAASGQLLRPVTLELGGKSPAIVLDDAETDVVAQNILKVSMRNTGQTCKACTRLLVPSSRVDEIVDAVSDAVRSAKLGDPFDPETFFGPLVSARQLDRVSGYLASGHSEGAKATVGGARATTFERGHFVQPTVFRDVSPDMRIAREEIFGPVLSILEYGSVDDAVRMANDSPYGLAATVFGDDPDRADDVARRLHTGNVGINHYGSNAAAPFGGHKDSGLGTEFALEGLEQYLVYTSIHHQA